MSRKTMLAYITGSVDQELLLRNEYLAEENHILRARLKGRPRLSDPEWISLARIGKRPGPKALQEVASIFKPDTIPGLHRKPVEVRRLQAPEASGPPEGLQGGREADPANGTGDPDPGQRPDRGSSAQPRPRGSRPDGRQHPQAQWVGFRQGAERGQELEFLRAHMDVSAPADFFTAEAWTKFGLATYYGLFFIHLASRKGHITGVTPSRDETWTKQIARNLTMEGLGFPAGIPCRFLIHDRDSKFTESYRSILDGSGIKTVLLPRESEPEFLRGEVGAFSRAGGPG